MSMRCDAVCTIFISVVECGVLSVGNNCIKHLYHIQLQRDLFRFIYLECETEIDEDSYKVWSMIIYWIKNGSTFDSTFVATDIMPCSNIFCKQKNDKHEKNDDPSH